MSDREKKLEQLLKVVVKMREQQKVYFKTRNISALTKSREYESKVDSICKSLTEQNLFNESA